MKKLQRIFAVLLAVSMLMSLLSVTAFADEEGSAPPSAIQIVKKGEDKTSEDKKVTFSKHIEGTDTENVFDITLNVTTQTSIEEVYKQAASTAVVIVMDISHSMKERFADADGKNTNRYEAAMTAAESFMNSYAAIANPTGADRKIGFVAFNTDAHKIQDMTDASKADFSSIDHTLDAKIGDKDFCRGGQGYCLTAQQSNLENTCSYNNSKSNASDKDNSARFTNIEAGLKMGYDMLAASGAANQYIVFLSDGFPTTYVKTGYNGWNPYCSSGTKGADGVFYDYYRGTYCKYGTSYSDKAAEKAEAQAATIKAAGVEIYSIGINVEGQSIAAYNAQYDTQADKSFSVVDCNPDYEDGYVIQDGKFKNWLKGSKTAGIGSGHYEDSTDVASMNAAFAAILEAVKESVETSANASWVASDPMGTTTAQSIDFLQFFDKNGNLVNGNLTGTSTENGENTAAFAENAISWDLKKSGYTKTGSGSTTTYTYTLKYRVRLATEVAGFTEYDKEAQKGEYATNGKTELSYQISTNGELDKVKKLDVEVPSVKGYVGEFSFKKVDSVTDAALPGATFTLKHAADCAYCKADGVTHPNEMHAAFTADGCSVKSAEETGLVSFTGIPSGHTYTLQETTAPAGHKLSKATYTVTVAYGKTTVDGDTWTATTATVKNVEATSVSVTKMWQKDNPQIRPASITVHLLANGVDTGKTAALNDDNNWKYEFTGLDKFDDNGNVIKYTVTEDKVEGYTGSVTGDATNGFTITNTPEAISVTVTKRWEDAYNQDGKRPGSVTVHLLANGQDTGKTATLNADNNWKYEFTGLDKFANSEEIAYTVREDKVDGYKDPTYTKTEKGWDITNSYTPETTSVSGTKTWDDKNDQDRKRPDSITVNLLANGEQVASKTVTANDGWKYEFTGLDKYANGKAIIYTVTEDVVKDYTTAVSGFDITNSYTPGVTSVQVTKVWNDDNDRDGLRPASIQVQLYADGAASGAPVTLTSENWTYSWTNLPEKEAGKTIEYTVAEVKSDAVTVVDVNDDTPVEVVPDYISDVTNDGNNFTITNYHIPAVTSVSGTKTWKNDSERNRPDSITVHLFADGVDTGKTATVTAEDEWTYGFYQLPKNDKGKEIVYTVTEDQVDGYKAPTYTETENGWDITNTKKTTTSPDPTPTTITVSGTKKWKNDSEENRPGSITVRLYADGKEVDSKTVTAADGWKYTFTDLPKTANGKKITYTVSEDAVEGYTTTVSGYNITNTYEPTEPTDPTPTPPDPTDPTPTTPDPNENIPDGSTPTTNTPSGTPSENIPDDIPGANVPRTGDPFGLWAALSALSGAGLLLTSRRKREDEEN